MTDRTYATLMALGVFLVLMMALAGCSETHQPNEYDRYVQSCKAMGGFTSMTHGATWSMNARFQCIGPNGPLMPEIGYN